MTEQTAHPADTMTDLPTAVRVSQGLGKFAETVGKAGTFFMLPLVFITMWDVFQRKTLKFIGDIMLDQGWIEVRDWMYATLLNILPFQSTLLQELEWHSHTALFALVLGYGYVYNRHVRVDLVREKLAFRKQAWIELIGCTMLMIPFCLIVIWFAFDYALQAYLDNEQSASLVGLSHRWIIKSILVFGLIVAALAGFAVWLETVLVLFGPKDLQFELMTLEREDQKVDRRLSLDAEGPQSLSDRQKLAGA
jgi:TRAP-type mannitol/chloroaromatic compound transport system permease small subunit